MTTMPDWAAAPAWAQWWAYDFDGAAWWFEHEPYRGQFCWFGEGQRQPAGLVARVMKPSWRNTKLSRPAQYR